MAKQIFIKFTIDGAIVQAESSAANIRQGDSNGEVSIIASVTGRTTAGYLARVHFERPDGKKANVVMTPSSEYSDRFVYVCESAWFFAVPGQAKVTVTMTDSGGAVSAQGTYEFAVAATTVDVIDSTLTYDEAAALEGLIADVSAQVSALSKLTSNPVAEAYSLTRNAFRTSLTGYSAEAIGLIGNYAIKKNGASLTEEDVLEYMSIMFGTEMVPPGDMTSESGRQAILILDSGEMYRLMYGASGGVHDLYAIRLSCSPAKLREELGQSISTAALIAGGQNTKIAANDNEVEITDTTTKNGLHVGGGFIYFVSLDNKYFLPNNAGGASSDAFILASKAYADSAAATIRSALQAEIDTVNATQNVVDIVGTKAALLAYVTTNLQSDDKIEVLVDESQNGANTIYSWTGSAWALIGSKAPYYSISQIDSMLLSYATTSWVDSNYVSLTKGGYVNMAEAPSSPNTYYFGAKNGTSSFLRLSDNSFDVKTTRGDVVMQLMLNFSNSNLARFVKIDGSTTPSTMSVTEIPFKQGVHSLVLDDDLSDTNARVTALESKTAKQESDIQYLYRQVIGGGDLVTATDSSVALASQPFPLTVSPKALLDYVGSMCQKVNQLYNITDYSDTRNNVTITRTASTRTIAVSTSGTASASGDIPVGRVSFVSGHKYFIHYNGSKTDLALVIQQYNRGTFVRNKNSDARNNIILDYSDGDFNALNFVLAYSSGSAPSANMQFTIVDINNAYPTDTPTSTSDARIQWLISYLSEHPEYNDGSILTAPVTKVVSKGFNLWDEEWEQGYINNDGTIGVNDPAIHSKNYTSVIPNATMYCYCGSSGVGVKHIFYDRDKNFISLVWRANGTFSVPENARYYKVTTNLQYGNTYKGDICINVSNASLNGTYKPYRAPIEYPIPAEVRALEGYGYGLSDALYNYIDFADKKYVKKVGSYTFTGQEVWTASNNAYQSNITGLSNLVRKASVNNVVFSWQVNDAGLKATSGDDLYIGTDTSGIAVITNGNIFIGSDDYANRANLVGKTIYFQLAAPVETDISGYIDSDVIEVTAGGRLEFENENDMGVPYSATYQCEPNP